MTPIPCRSLLSQLTVNPILFGITSYVVLAVFAFLDIKAVFPLTIFGNAQSLQKGQGCMHTGSYTQHPCRSNVQSMHVSPFIVMSRHCNQVHLQICLAVRECSDSLHPGCPRCAGVDTLGRQQHPLSPLALELPRVAAPLIPFLALSPALDLQSAPASSKQQSVQSSSNDAPGEAETRLDAESAAALALPPVLLPRHRTYQLSEKGILEMTGVSLMGMLTQLNLHGSALKKIEASNPVLMSFPRHSLTSWSAVICVFTNLAFFQRERH